jgi:hypothetical protein
MSLDTSVYASTLPEDLPPLCQQLLIRAHECILTARAQERADGDAETAGRGYTEAAELMLAALDAAQPQRDDGDDQAVWGSAFLAALRPKVLDYLERARLLFDVALEAEEFVQVEPPTDL